MEILLAARRFLPDYYLAPPPYLANIILQEGHHAYPQNINIII